jgi:hypothetical protein
MDDLIEKLDSNFHLLDENKTNDQITGNIKDVIREWKDHTRGYINELTDAID